MAILSTAKIVGMLASAKKTGKQILNAAGEYVAEVVEDFMSGFAGYGWKIWEYVKGKWMLEIDSIRVREQFIVCLRCWCQRCGRSLVHWALVRRVVRLLR